MGGAEEGDRNGIGGGGERGVIHYAAVTAANVCTAFDTCCQKKPRPVALCPPPSSTPPPHPPELGGYGQSRKVTQVPMARQCRIAEDWYVLEYRVS